MDDKIAKKLLTERKKLRKERESLSNKLWKSNLCSPDAERYRGRLKEIEAIFEEKGATFQAAFAHFLVA